MSPQPASQRPRHSGEGSTASPGSAPSAWKSQLEQTRAAAHPRCVMCGAANAWGLPLSFDVERPGAVRTCLTCPESLQSYPGTLHGGAISALLDAAMTNALFSMGVVAVTGELNVRFIAPARPNEPAIVRASVDDASFPPLYRVRSELEQGGRVVARGSGKFVARED